MAVPDSAMPNRQLTNGTVLLAGAKPVKYGLLISSQPRADYPAELVFFCLSRERRFSRTCGTQR